MRSSAIAIFAYKRPAHLKNLLQSLTENAGIENLDVFVFIDGPKTRFEDKIIEDVRLIAMNFSVQLNPKIEVSNINLGLANSIRTNVTKLFEDYETLIILEDDLIISKSFLSFMLNGLQVFANETKIAAISGYSYPISDRSGGGYILPGGDCWGWATWKDRWERVDWNPDTLQSALQNSGRTEIFNLGGAYDYSGMLVDARLHLIDSWAIYWHASMFLLGKYTYYPTKTLVLNTGMDQSGTHFNSKSKTFDHPNLLNNQVAEIQTDDLQDLSSELSSLYRHSRGSNFSIVTYKLYRGLRRMKRRIRFTRL